MNCPACGSARVSQAFSYASFDNHLRVDAWTAGLERDLTLKPEAARVCGDCGYVMLFLAADALAKVRGIIK
jgi:hypothetical protein